MEHVVRRIGRTVLVSVDRGPIHAELQSTLTVFHELLATASPEALGRRSNGTRWTNEQLLYHMMFGYIIVRTLLPLVRLFGRLPSRASLVFAAVLNASARPFHAINYLGSWGGAVVVNRDRMGPRMARVIGSLQRELDGESEASLRRGMHFPPRWDPYFRDWMTLEDVYRYGTVHFDAHRRQLTLQ